MPFNMDAGVKSLLENITTILRSDATLKSLVNYDSKAPNIRRGFQVDGEWKTLLVYYFQPEIIAENVDFSPDFRVVPLIINMWAKQNELVLYDISERVIELLDGQESALTKAGKNFVYSSAYNGVMIELTLDAQRVAYNRALRFMITFRKETT
jgi:hypothetical protein